MFLPLIVSALTECPRFGIIQETIPCIQPSTFNPGTCTDHNLTLFTSTGDAVLNTTWFSYTPNCAFNITGIEETGIYCYNSTIEDGCITLARADNMLSIILVQIGLVIFFIALGLPHKFGFIKFTAWGMAVIEVLMTIWIVLIVETGGDITRLLAINAYAAMSLGGLLGFVAVFMVMVRLATGGEKDIKDDSYTKFIFDNKFNDK